MYNFETSQLPNLQNPNLQMIVQSDIPTIQLHRLGAQAELAQVQSVSLASNSYYRTRNGRIIIGSYESLYGRAPTSDELNAWATALRRQGLVRVYRQIAQAGYGPNGQPVQPVPYRGYRLLNYLLSEASRAGYA
jgi:hypothetical protein